MGMHDTMSWGDDIHAVVMVMIRMPYMPRSWWPRMPIGWIIMIIIR